MLIYIFRIRFSNKKIEKYLRYGLALILIIQEIAFHIWAVSIKEWSITWSLPLQLCGVSAILSIIMLLNQSYYIYEIAYFIGIGGAVQAILTPEIGMYTYPHFRYFQFFIGHGAIITACLFMTFVKGYKPKFSSLWKTVVFLNIYAAFVGVFNKLTGANYLFLCSKPEVSSIMDLLGPWPWYLVSLEIMALIIFYLLYLPFAGGSVKTGRGIEI